MFFTLLCIFILIGFISFLFDNKGKSKPNHISDGLDKYRRPFTAEELKQGSENVKKYENTLKQNQTLKETPSPETLQRLAKENEERLKQIEIKKAQVKKEELEKYERIRIAREKAAKKEEAISNELKLEREKIREKDDFLRKIVTREINRYKQMKPTPDSFSLDLHEIDLDLSISTSELELSNIDEIIETVKFFIQWHKDDYEAELRRDAIEESEHQYRINSGYYNEYDD